MVQVAVVVVEAEEQRSDSGTVLVLPVAGDHAIGRAQMLHLHHRALALVVRLAAGLGEHSVEPRAFEPREPVGRDVGIVGCRREMHRRLGLPQQLLEPAATLRERLPSPVLVALREQVERHK